MKRNLLLVFIAALSCITLACGSPREEEPKSAAPSVPTDIKEFIEVKCTMCHFTDRIYKDKHYPMEWVRIVNRMKAKNPNWITQDDADKILDYLLKNNSKPESE